MIIVKKTENDEVNKKGAIVAILKVLQEYSNEEHFLTQQDIIDYVKKDYGFVLKRRAVSSALKILSDVFEYDINTSDNKRGVALFEREFDKTEIRFLIDAVLSSRSLNTSRAKGLIKKIDSIQSIDDRKDYSEITKTYDGMRSKEVDTFYNIDLILSAIKQNCKITFNYLWYDVNGKQKVSSHIPPFTCSPYFLVNNFGRYYLLCVKDDKEMRSFRVDYLKDVQLLSEKRIPMEEAPNFGKDFSVNEYLKDHIYVYGGDVIECQVELLSKRYLTYIFDWFGKNATAEKKDDKLIATIRSNENAFFYWAMQYSEGIRVLSPQKMVDRIKQEAKNILERYE